MITIQAPSAYSTEVFASNICKDDNPIHKAGDKQIVPGDWLVSKYLENFGITKGALTFSFTKKITPEIMINMRENDGAYTIDNKCVVKIKSSEVPIFEIPKPHSLSNIEDVSHDYGTLASHYCQTSGSIGQFLLDNTLKEGGFNRGVKSVFIYKDAEIIAYCDNGLQSPELEKKITEPIVCLRPTATGGNGYVTFQFPLYKKKSNSLVGVIKKTVACLRLEKY